MIKAIVFDYDGTLSNGVLFDYEALYDYFKRYFSDMGEMEYEAMIQDLNNSKIHSCGPQNFRYRCHQYLEKYQITEEMIVNLEAYWETEAFKFAKLRDNALDVVKELRKKYKIGICTNGGALRQHRKIEICGLEPYIDSLTISAEVGAHKPNIKMYQDVIDKLHVEFNECVYIGDSFSGDVYGAYKCGMYPVWFNGNKDVTGGCDITKIYDLDELIPLVEKLDE